MTDKHQQNPQNPPSIDKHQQNPQIKGCDGQRSTSFGVGNRGDGGRRFSQRSWWRRRGAGGVMTVVENVAGGVMTVGR